MPNVAKLLPFPNPVRINKVVQTITLSIGAERYAMTIEAKIERVTASPMDRSSPDFQRDRETMQNNTSAAPEPLAAVGAQAPDIGPRAVKTGKKATAVETRHKANPRQVQHE